MHQPLPCLLLPFLFLGCAEGGDEDRAESEVKINASHHLFGFRSLPGFGTFPVRPEVSVPDRGTLNLTDQSTYTVVRTGGTSPADAYFLAFNGQLSIQVTGSGREPSVSFRGAYGLVSTLTPDFFFCDRTSTASSQSLGLYFGTKFVTTPVDLAGGWHVLSLHLVFANPAGNPLATHNNVALAASGAVSVTAATTDNVSGTGDESSGRDLTFGGTIGALSNGVVNLTLRYGNSWSSQNNEDRVFSAGAGKGLVLGVDSDETDSEAGLAVLVRKFDAPTTVATVAGLAGEYLVGGHTVFVNPANAGSDAAVGRLTLSSQGSFRLDLVGSRGIEVGYSGTFALADDGGITFTVGGTNETWHGAVNHDYTTVAMVDDFVETRTNNLPELSLYFGVREKPPE